MYNAGKVAIFYYTILVFSLIFDATILGVFPIFLSVLGAICILIAAIGTTLLKSDDPELEPDQEDPLPNLK